MITVTGTRENYIAEMTTDRGTLHATHCDIPVEQGGQNAYLRPGETLLSALGACMNITARKYLNRDGLDYDTVTVQARDGTGKRRHQDPHQAGDSRCPERGGQGAHHCRSGLLPGVRDPVRPHRAGQAGLTPYPARFTEPHPKSPRWGLFLFCQREEEKPAKNGDLQFTLSIFFKNAEFFG